MANKTPTQSDCSLTGWEVTVRAAGWLKWPVLEDAGG